MELSYMTIRRMEVNDLEFFHRVRTSSLEYIHNQTEYSYGDVLVWFNNLNQPNNGYYIAEIGGVPIGYFRTSNWDLINGHAYVGMDIAEEHRGKGYAIPAYKEFFKKLRKENGLHTVYLEVLNTNRRAIHVYNKLGFTILKVLPYEGGDAFTCSVKMGLKL